MNDEQRNKFEDFMAIQFVDSIDRRRCKNGDGNDYMSWDMNVARAVWQHLTSCDGWIKCSDKLPNDEASDWIMVYLANGNTEMALYDSFDKFTDGDLYSFCSEVTHWRPLPPSPKD